MIESFGNCLREKVRDCEKSDQTGIEKVRLLHRRMTFRDGLTLTNPIESKFLGNGRVGSRVLKCKVCCRPRFLKQMWLEGTQSGALQEREILGGSLCFTVCIFRDF
jgi:hypothetical protein